MHACGLFGLTSALRDRRPDLVVSGADTEANVGLLANHSGTVGAPLTGTEFGVPSIAVSTASGRAERVAPGRGRELRW